MTCLINEAPLIHLKGYKMAPSSLPASDLIAMSKEKGLLAKQLYIVSTTPTNGMEAVMANLEAHLAFQAELESSGIMFAAGPNWTEDEQEWRGEGTVVIRADSLTAAREIAAKDPMHSSGAREFSVRPWFVNEGKVSLELSFSTGTFKMV